MARPGLERHPKFLRLVHLLREPVPHVLGYLECMWKVGYESGDPRLGDATGVELAAQWPGEPGKLVKALLECRTHPGGAGFIEETEPGQYQIRDLLDHAPRYVKLRRQREDERTGKPRVRTVSAHCAHKTELDSTLCASPSPSPSPSPKKDPPTPPEGGGSPRLSAAEFLKAWNAVPQFSHARGLTGKRLRCLQARTKDADFVTNWECALERASRSRFCRGENDRGWRATVEWFLRPDTLTKILEGRYDENGAQKGNTHAAKQADDERRRQKYTPAPGDPGG